MTRKPTSNDPNAPMITVATAPDVPELHPLRWVIVDAGAGKTLAAAPTTVGLDGQIRAIAFAPTFQGGAGVWMLQVEHLPKGLDVQLTPPGNIPCTCSLQDHAPECATNWSRYPTIEEVRSAMRFLVPDEVVLTLTLMPWFVAQPRNLVQLVQMATLKTPSPLHKLKA